MSPLIGNSPRFIGAVDVDETVAFLREAADAAEAALRPSRRLLDDSEGRRLAGQLATAFADGEALYNEAAAERERISNDDTTRPDLLHSQLSTYSAEYSRRSSEITRLIASLAEQLTEALREEAVPQSAGASETIVARQEVEAALGADSRSEPGQQKGAFEVLRGFAEQGGELAAAVASGWGKSMLAAQTGGAEGYDEVVNVAGRSSLGGSEEGPRRAAEALEALDLAEAIAKLNFVLGMAGEMLLVKPGSVS